METKAPPSPTLSAVSGEVIPPGTLSLSEQVNNEHRQVKECVIKGALHAVRAGELLWQAKRKAVHGQWLEWIAESCEFSERTAAGTGRTRGERAKYLSKTDRALVADHSLGPPLSHAPEPLPRDHRKNNICFAPQIAAKPLINLDNLEKGCNRMGML